MFPKTLTCLDQFYPWILHQNSGSSLEFSLQQRYEIPLELSGLPWTNSAQVPIRWVPREFHISVAKRILRNCQSFCEEFMGRIGQNNLNSLGNTEKMCIMSVQLVWTNSSHGFIVITLAHSKQFPWNSVDMRSMALEVVSTNIAHEFTKFQSHTTHTHSQNVTTSTRAPPTCAWIREDTALSRMVDQHKTVRDNTERCYG